MQYPVSEDTESVEEVNHIPEKKYLKTATIGPNLQFELILIPQGFL
jgi:hypothetical protein